jgi:hypothetical protein
MEPQAVGRHLLEDDYAATRFLRVFAPVPDHLMSVFRVATGKYYRSMAAMGG